MRSTRARTGIVALAAAVASACYAPTVARERSYHPSDADLTITRIVHASLIADFGTTRILVDPWFSPAPPLGMREAIGLAPDRLPPLRGLLITHRHTDHYDREALQNLSHQPLRVVTVTGLGADIRSLGYADVVEVDAWEKTQIGNVIVTAVPAEHSSAEVGYVLQEGPLSVYVAGDTRFDASIFRAIAESFPSLDVAILPVGGIRIFGRRLDMSAEEAAEAVRILGPKRVVPYHYGMTGPYPFVLTSYEPQRTFARRVEERNGGGVAVVTLEPGESWHYYR